MENKVENSLFVIIHTYILFSISIRGLFQICFDLLSAKPGLLQVYYLVPLLLMYLITQLTGHFELALPGWLWLENTVYIGE